MGPAYRSSGPETGAEGIDASIAKYDAGEAIVKRGRLTVGQWLVQWLEDKERTCKDSTFATYSGHVNKHLIPGLGHIRHQVGPRDITRFENDQRTSGGRGGKGLSETTVQHLHVTLRSALQAAVEDRLVATNAVDAIRKDARPTRDSHEMMTWDWDQLGTFLDKVKDHRFANIFTVMATTGAEAGRGARSPLVRHRLEGPHDQHPPIADVRLVPGR